MTGLIGWFLVVPLLAAQPIDAGTPVSGRLEASDEGLGDGRHVDVYDFRAEAGQRVRITLRSDAFDPYLILEGANRFRFENDDDPELGNGSRIDLVLPTAGIFKIRATSFTPGSTGAYDLLLEFPAAGGTAPPPGGESGGTAPPAPERTVHRGRLEAGDATLRDGEYFDTYRFEGRVGQSVRITMISADFDAYLVLKPPSADATVPEQMPQNDDGPEMGTHSRIDAVLTESGTYEVWATSLEPAQVGGYEVAIETGGGASSGGTSLFERAGSIENAVDPFCTINFELESGVTYIIETTGLSEGCDTVLELRRSTDPATWFDTDPIVGEDDDGGGGRASRITWVCDRTGPYYARVRSFGAALGTFRVVVHRGGSGATSGGGTPTGGGGAPPVPSGTLVAAFDASFPGNEPVSTGDFELAAGGTYVVRTTGLSGGCDTIIELRRSTNTESWFETDPVLGRDDDGEGGRASRLSWTCDTAGRYYVLVRPYSADTLGSFRVEIYRQ